MVNWIVTVMPDLPRERTALKEPIQKIRPFLKVLSQARIKEFPSTDTLESMLCMFDDKPKILDALAKCRDATHFQYGIYCKILWRTMSVLFDLDNNTKKVANRARKANSLANWSMEKREKFLNEFLEDLPKVKGSKGLENPLENYTGRMGLELSKLNLSISNREEVMDKMFAGQEEAGLELEELETDVIIDDLSVESIVSSNIAPLGNDSDLLDVP
ncbi:hypothetical protein QR680_011412 [Steinernema hermaphroditum]|uniref:Uncharacterized protein n=1 Tax=Steinernema hermaphroditum TaxID=289476 RepID=A0AA39MDB6_9BILA|nr:hypothetical protein QR680_011412 [Steinernema hermaphroditum]